MKMMTTTVMVASVADPHHSPPQCQMIFGLEVEDPMARELLMAVVLEAKTRAEFAWTPMPVEAHRDWLPTLRLEVLVKLVSTWMLVPASHATTRVQHPAP
jgi:hypothetical protein